MRATGGRNLSGEPFLLLPASRTLAGVRSATKGGEGEFQSRNVLAPASALEAVLLIRRTGALVDAWTRHPIPREVVTVMAATMIGSIETLVGALGGASPETVLVEVDDRRILATKMDSYSLLVAIAAPKVSEAALRREAQQIATRIKTNGGLASREKLVAPARSSNH